MNFLRYVRPDENWVRLAVSISATAELVGYEATKVANNDPAWPWWSGATGAGLSVDFGAAREIGVLALIHNNGDAGRAINVTGDVITTMQAARQANGWPRNVGYVLPPTINGNNLTFTIAGNSLDWAIGELVVGKLRELQFPLDRGARRTHTRQVIRDVDSGGYEHEIRHDKGCEIWSLTGRIFSHDASLDELIAWWESTLGGVLPTLVIPNETDSEPRLCRMDMVFSHSNDGQQQHWVDLTLTEQSRGILVV